MVEYSDQNSDLIVKSNFAGAVMTLAWKFQMVRRLRL
jgi:hypothetical protein